MAVAGVPSQPDTYYFGATGGGIWKTTDGGLIWVPVSDGQFETGSVGALAVAESDPNVIYAGMGEACVRGNASPGDGVYKSTDGGKTWKQRRPRGQLPEHIGAVCVDPQQSEHRLRRGAGHIFGPNEERGVYRSTRRRRDLETGPDARAERRARWIYRMDPSNPHVIYAAFWEV